MSDYIELIVAVAIRCPSGEVFSLRAPYRHHHLIHWLARQLGVNNPECEQGFVNDRGEFLTRQSAAFVALANGQATTLIAPPDLYSEDLW